MRALSTTLIALALALGLGLDASTPGANQAYAAAAKNKSKPSISLPRKAAVNDAVVRLGDVARFKGFTADARDTFAAIELGRAPAVGLGQFMPRAYIEARIREGGVPPGVRLRIPGRVEITRQARVIEGEALMERVRGAIVKRMPHDPNDVAGIDVPRLSDLKMPEGARVDVRFATGEDFDGAVVAELVVRDGKEVIRSRRISTRVDVFTTVYGVREAIRRGQKLSSADLVEIRVSRAKLARDVVARPEFIDGAMLRRSIEPGEPIREAWLTIPPLVNRGDRVRMVAVRGALRLTARGEALSSGIEGAFVRVRNIDSKKIVSGRVTGPGMVEMEF